MFKMLPMVAYPHRVIHSLIQPTPQSFIPQVVAKKKAPKPIENSEPVKPKTIQEALKDQIGDALKEAGTARTCALSLDGMEFAQELSNTLLKAAGEVESLYKKVRGALNKNVLDKELKGFIGAMTKKVEAVKKLKARLGPAHRFSKQLFPCQNQSSSMLKRSYHFRPFQ